MIEKQNDTQLVLFSNSLKVHQTRMVWSFSIGIKTSR